MAHARPTLFRSVVGELRESVGRLWDASWVQ
jgi:hypothetical protein